MRIRMTKTAAGPDGVKMAGKVYDVPVQEARALVAADAAVFLEKPPQPAEPVMETASIQPEEAAVMPKPQPKRGRKGKKK